MRKTLDKQPGPPDLLRYTAGPSKKAMKPIGGVIGMDTAKRSYTPAPAPRFAPEPGFRGPFELAGVGRDVTTGKAWGES